MANGSIMTPDKKEAKLLSGESCSKLQISAKRGVLSAHQTDDQVHTTWTCQEETCPICRERIPWHRGMVVQNGHQLIWVCMVCSILEIGAIKKQPPRVIRELPTERITPLPPGYVLAWLNTIWILPIAGHVGLGALLQRFRERPKAFPSVIPCWSVPARRPLAHRGVMGRAGRVQRLHFPSLGMLNCFTASRARRPQAHRRARRITWRGSCPRCPLRVAYMGSRFFGP